jgi:hypothetical protein
MKGTVCLICVTFQRIQRIIAKGNLLEWTTAVLDNDIVKLGLKANWNGVTLLEFAGGNATLAAIIAAQFPALM